MKPGPNYPDDHLGGLINISPRQELFIFLVTGGGGPLTSRSQEAVICETSESSSFSFLHSGSFVCYLVEATAIILPNNHISVLAEGPSIANKSKLALAITST